MAGHAGPCVRAVQLGVPRLLPDGQSLPSCDRNARGQSLERHASLERRLHPDFQPRPPECVGHVFQGRFKAILVEKDSYLLELARYVVLNPLRARMVRQLDNWPWSSYLATCGQTPSPNWLQCDFILSLFSARRSLAVTKYIAFVHAGKGLPSLWDNLKGQIYLGSEQFIEQMQALLDRPRIGRYALV